MLMVDPQIREIQRRAAAANIPMARVLRTANVHQSTWTRWASGAFSPKLSTFRRVQDALDAVLGGQA